MDSDAARLTWTYYERAWSESRHEECARLLEFCVTDNCTFVNPSAEGRGPQELLRTIAAFQQQVPGGKFETRAFISHHQDLLASWNLVDKDGNTLLVGHNAGHMNEAGLFEHVAGFW